MNTHTHTRSRTSFACHKLSFLILTVTNPFRGEQNNKEEEKEKKEEVGLREVSLNVVGR
jgi:hypothetical protein